MPRNGFFESISYITAAGKEVVLSQQGSRNIWMMSGRSGFLAPEVKTESVNLANGATQTLAAQLQPRDVTLKMGVAAQTRTDALKIYNRIVTDIIQIGVRDRWGKLKIRKPSGEYYYLNCLYTNGLNVPETYRNVFLFSLEFHADDPLFYAGNDTVQVLTTYVDGDYLHFGSAFTFGSETFFRSSGMTKTYMVSLPSYRAYPLITITGPADNIMVRNETTGRELSFMPDFRLRAGEQAVIKTDPLDPSVMVEGVSGLKYLTPESNIDWYLVNGVNEITYRNTDNNPVSTCELRYREGWLSV